jgi:hypothetical protein
MRNIGPHLNANAAGNEYAAAAFLLRRHTISRLSHLSRRAPGWAPRAGARIFFRCGALAMDVTVGTPSLHPSSDIVPASHAT